MPMTEMGVIESGGVDLLHGGRAVVFGRETAEGEKGEEG
jgi:hypothetical protein